MTLNFPKIIDVEDRAMRLVHHRMIVRARHRARGGRWWWQQGRKATRHVSNGQVASHSM